jgi:DNA-binding GntR family transcriptional regulator
MGNEVFVPIAQGNLSNRVVEEIKRAIMQGKLKPGERIVERNIADQMGLSLAPVREAFQILDHQGVLTRIQRSGTFIRKFSRKDIIEIFSLRAILESQAVRLFVQHCSEEGNKQLEQVLQQIQNAAKENNRMEASLYDLKFHETIVKLSGYELLASFSGSLAEVTLLYLADMNKLYPDLQIVVDDHMDLFDAIKSGNADKASKAIVNHMLDGAKTLLRTMPDDNTASWDISDLDLDKLYG